MLSGSAILRVSLLLVVAGCLAGLVQYVLPRAAPAPDAPAPAAPAPAPRRIELPPSAPRPVPAPPDAPAAGPPPAPVPTPRPNVEAPAAPDAAPAPPPPSQPPAAAPAAEADDDAGPRAAALVDLNGASLAELNGLRGGGSIGRAIIQRRPYAAVEQLLSRRVLSRATYDRIKDQVTVR